MTYHNPIIPGFHPDPSAIRVKDTYYLVTSSFNYFPGVPLFESRDLLNWHQIGHVLTRASQLPLAGSNTHGGIYAPTLRYHAGRFYMVTTNVDHGGNFYVWTDDIHGEWSEPIPVEQGGIDPSLYFEGDTAYFMSNGDDDAGKHGITQCEIDIATGKKLTPSRVIWTGAGGRYLEGPHLYRKDGWYYLIASEGGTEYGHMLVYARGKTPYGPFENFPGNPVLTNRNLGGYQIQGTGHADLVDDGHGNWFLVHLAFRQLDRWTQHHTLGREVYLTPAKFDEAGWFTAGEDGTTRLAMSAKSLADVKQAPAHDLTFANTQMGREWVTLRDPQQEHYAFDGTTLGLRPNGFALEEPAESPTALMIRQAHLNVTVSVRVETVKNLVGLTAYMENDQHYDIVVWQADEALHVARRLRVGPALALDHELTLPLQPVTLIMEADPDAYHLVVESGGQRHDLGSAQARFLSSEVAVNFTGVMFGLFAEDNWHTPQWNTLTDFQYHITEANHE
ncbi:family 43 glycosylhydrolase [Lacticaseibacillus jixianensis]|uniref:Family 43 glycosylhydrolase n=1 Tax=Lacticaseibacillus jixianensis TaxID=2486012 RepID=A0ABW4B6W7_9LACO|nr:glycoside hydrolase family 43 protein [Lacticaseibacillus jixianensis]